MFNPHHLRILHTVAALESYSRAAERLGISQPAVSMQIRKLEEAVGVPLVVTRGRQVSLTEAGTALHCYATRILRLNEEIEQSMLDFREGRRGRVRLAASSTPGVYVLPGVIASFRARHPAPEVTLKVGNARSSLRLVAEGLADMAMVGDISPDGLEVRMEPLCDDCLTVVVPSGHPWAGRAAVGPEELAREPLILREEGSSTRQVLDDRLAGAGLKVRVSMELGSTEAVREAVAAGLGAAVLSGWAVRREIEAGRLASVKVSGLDLRRRICLALAGSGEVSPVAALFIAHLRQSDLGGGCLP